MRLRAFRWRRLRRAGPPAVFIALMAYFLYHAVQGEHGLLALKALDARADQLAPRAAALRAERRALEARVALMQPDNIDPDLLDEEVRRRLGYVRPGEIVILDPERLLESEAARE